MLNLDQLSAIRNQSRDALGRMEQRAAALNTAIARLKADPDRSSDFKIKEITRLKAEALQPMGADHALLQTNNKTVATSHDAWSNKPYLLSKIPFDKDPKTDAAMRLQASSELRAMPKELLELTLANAREDNNLALLFQGYLVTPPSEQAGFDLKDVVIHGQVDALAMLGTIASAVPMGEFHAKTATASGPSSIDKMKAGRAAADALG